MGGSQWHFYGTRLPCTFVLLFPLCGECGGGEDNDDDQIAAVTFLPRNSQGTISRWQAYSPLHTAARCAALSEAC